MIDKYLLDDVIDILAKYDLAGLIKLGAPHHEYNPEARAIVQLLPEGRLHLAIDEIDVQHGIYGIFCVMLGMRTCRTFDYFYAAAHEIYVRYYIGQSKLAPPIP